MQVEKSSARSFEMFCLATRGDHVILPIMGFTKKQRRDQRKHQFAPKTKTKIPKKAKPENTEEQAIATDQQPAEETQS